MNLKTVSKLLQQEYSFFPDKYDNIIFYLTVESILRCLFEIKIRPVKINIYIYIYEITKSISFIRFDSLFNPFFFFLRKFKKPAGKPMKYLKYKRKKSV